MYTNTPFFDRDLPAECHDRLRTFANDGHRIVWVAFPPAGGNSWSIVTDTTFFNRNIPDECHQQMKTFTAAGHKIRCVAFPPAGGNSWSIVTDKTFFNRNVPSECHDKMKALAAGGTSLTSVAFPKAGGNRWTVEGESSFFNRGVPGECHRVMRAMSGVGLGPLRQVAFHPGGGFVVVARADALYAAPAPLIHNGASFDLDAFAANIKSQFAGKGAKYGLVVRQGGAIRAITDGPKRTATTPPAQDFTVFDRFSPASVAKTPTAVALLQLIHQHGLSITEPIVNHLPSDWQIGPLVDTITVEELLHHTSGFRAGARFYDELEDMVAAGVTAADKAIAEYHNCNYSLARVVVAHLNGVNEQVADQGKATSDNFIDYVRTHVFDPLGVPDVDWRPDAVAPTLCYPTPPGTSPGTTYGDASLRPGPSGLDISLAELAIFVNALATTDTLLPQSMRTLMDDHGMGWGRLTDVQHGTYLRKGGYFPAAQNGGAVLHTGIWSFGTGVQAVVMHNGDPSLDMPTAYDAAWS